jgi:hypothetical protein
MRIEGHYDRDADTGLREIEPSTGRVVGLEYWKASSTLPSEFLGMLPPPGVATAA